jgi:hypothetical protein
MGFPDRQYFSLQNLCIRWNTQLDDLRYSIEHCELFACCWLDLREVMRFLPSKESCSITCDYIKFEGYVGVKANDCRKIFRCEKYSLTNFVDLEKAGYEIAILPQYRDAIISINDLMIPKNEVSRFEIFWGIIPVETCSDYKIIRFDPNKLYVNHANSEYVFHGVPMNLGAVQANIVAQLACAKSAGENPWIHGKTLLGNAGAQSIRMRDVFRTNKSWRKVIEGNKRGYYRIKSDIEVDVA